MKAAFIVGTLARGGAEKQLVYMLKALREKGVSVRVLCLTKGESYELEIANLNVPIDWVGQSQNRGKRILKIINNLRKTPVDVVQSSHFYTNIYAGAAGRILRIPSIGAIRSDLTYEISRQEIFVKAQICLPNFLAVNSNAAYRNAIDYGVSPKKIRVIRNVVESVPLGCGKSEIEPLKILFVGRLDANKHPERFVRLASNLNKNCPHINLRFQIAGDGELRGQLEKTARESGLKSDKMIFSGVCRNMDEIYRTADILISTSDREGTPNVVLEAMMHGVPVIASNAGDVAEIIGSDRGISVAPSNEQELMKAALFLINDKNLRNSFGQAGRKYVSENYSFENLKIALSQIYEKLVCTGKRKFDDKRIFIDETV